MSDMNEEEITLSSSMKAIALDASEEAAASEDVAAEKMAEEGLESDERKEEEKAIDNVAVQDDEVRGVVVEKLPAVESPAVESEPTTALTVPKEDDSRAVEGETDDSEAVNEPAAIDEGPAVVEEKQPTQQKVDSSSSSECAKSDAADSSEKGTLTIASTMMTATTSLTSDGVSSGLEEPSTTVEGRRGDEVLHVEEKSGEPPEKKAPKEEDSREDLGVPEAPSLISVESIASTPSVGAAATTTPAKDAPATLEECLYGSCYNSTEQEQEGSEQFVYHDEWEFIRPPGLWKTQPPHTISLSALRKFASQAGIHEEGSHRGLTWRVLLGYLPPDNSTWEAVLKEKRDLYTSFVADWFGDVPDCKNGEPLRWKRKVPNRAKRPVVSGFADVSESSQSSVGGNEEGEEDAVAMVEPETSTQFIPSPIKARFKEKSGMDASVLENLLKKNTNLLQLKGLVEISENSYDNDDSVTVEEGNAKFRDVAESAKLLDEIRKDVDRTFPDLSFFLDPDDNIGKRRYAAIERILFVWSKHNNGVKYVQGMNEIVGTIYYVFANDWNEEWASEAEADSYWLFNILMTSMQDVFVPDLDEADTGIQGRIEMLEKLLHRHDPEVKDHLDEIGVECSFFAIRWWTTLLSREFLLPDTIRLWDSMFASTHKDNFLCYVCVTMVTMVRGDLLKGDFARCLRLLQAYPPVLMDQLLQSSRALWVYERQITMACHKAGISLPQALQTVPPPNSIIMAFGFRDGIVPKTRAEMLEDAGEKAAERMREATSVMAEKAQGWLGRASRLVRRYRSQSVDSIRSMASGKSSSQGDAENVIESFDESDSVYMDAINSADAGKWSYK